MITNFENLVDIFNKMQTDGFEINAPLKWGFYFVDSDKAKLMSVFEELRDKNYVLEDIFSAEENGEDCTLHVSKIEVLTPEKLHKRNIAFNTLADYCEVALYDGWDVEKISL